MIGTTITILTIAYFLNSCMSNAAATCKLKILPRHNLDGTGH
jgi:hypothetical protein